VKPIQFQTILGRVATKSDGSLSLNFSTPEMSAEETTVLLLLCRRNLTMRLTPMGETLEAPVEVKNELQAKSQSQRLRGVLFVLFKQLQSAGNPSGQNWERFYSNNMEALINSVKAELDPQ
jgi:hypothetical protein